MAKIHAETLLKEEEWKGQSLRDPESVQGCSCIGKNRAGRSKRARDPENVVQNCNCAMRTGLWGLGASGAPHQVLAASSRQPGALGQFQVSGIPQGQDWGLSSAWSSMGYRIRHRHMMAGQGHGDMLCCRWLSEGKMGKARCAICGCKDFAEYMKCIKCHKHP